MQRGRGSTQSTSADCVNPSNDVRLAFSLDNNRAKHEPFGGPIFIDWANLVQSWIARFVDVCYIIVVHELLRLAQVMSDEKTQADKFKEAAREHGADTSVRRWDERIKKVAKAKPDKG